MFFSSTLSCAECPPLSTNTHVMLNLGDVCPLHSQSLLLITVCGISFLHLSLQLVPPPFSLSPLVYSGGISLPLQAFSLCFCICLLPLTLSLSVHVPFLSLHKHFDLFKIVPSCTSAIKRKWGSQKQCGWFGKVGLSVCYKQSEVSSSICEYPV